MVRNIAGGLVDLGLHRFSVEDFKRILDSKDRKQLGATAPAQGLCLEEVFYDDTRLQDVLADIKESNW